MRAFLVLCIVILMLGCGCPRAKLVDLSHADIAPVNGCEVMALRTPASVVMDGKLDDAIWKKSPRYALAPVIRKHSIAPKLQESGYVRFAWDDQYLYAAFECDDSDVVAEAASDGQHLYQFGDVCEVFLKPDQYPWYWEFHVSPRAQQSTFFWPSHGRRLPSALLSKNALTVAAHVSGTLNDYRDKDRGWTAEMAVPWALIREHQTSPDESISWRMLVGRYNYSAYLSDLEFSSLPQLARVDFHQVECYVRVRMVLSDNP